MRKILSLTLLVTLMFTLTSCAKENELTNETINGVNVSYDAETIFQEESAEALDVLTLYLENNNVLPLDITNYQFNTENTYIVEDDLKSIQIAVYYDNGDRFENMGIYNYDVNTKELYYFDVVANDYVKVSEKN